MEVRVLPPFTFTSDLETRPSQCVDGRNTLAVWELSDPDDIFNARLTIKHPGLSIVTEILTTLTLNKIAQSLNW
jgi:hypothetical protein